MDQQSLVEPRPPGRNVYAFDGQMLIMAAIATVFLFVVFLIALHLYARWWLRRGSAARRTHVFVLADNQHPASADHGLDPAVLSSLPVFTFSSKSAPAEEQERQRPLLECAVCLSEFEENEMGRLLPRCRHSFHTECIDMWFHSHSTCPLCRSPVESPADRSEPSPVVVVEVVEGSGSGSGSGLCETCEHEEGSENVAATSLARRRKAVGVKIEVAQPRIESEVTQSSPMTRMMSFKRLLSLGGMSPSGGRASPRYRAGTSRAAAELDLEGGLGEPVRVYTPK